MIDFEEYMPQRWIHEGLVTAFQRRDSTSASKSVKRPGTFRVGLSAIALAVGMISSTVSMAASEARVSNLREFHLTAADRVDDHIVPPSYWDVLSAAMHAAPQLPAQNREFDPPMAF